MHEPTDQREFVIVGGGPVGLWTGIQLKKRRPKASVVVYERHEEYQRNHVLRLEHASMLLYSKTTRDGHEAAFLRDVTGRSLRQIVLQPTGSVFIRTNDLERGLKTYAQALGIDIRYERAADPVAVMQAHPECGAFIAADGAHSGMRSALLGEDAIEHIALQYVAEVKYQAQGKAGQLGSIAEQYKTNRLLTHMAFEYVGREREGATPVTIRFFLDRETYEALPQTNFKTPLLLDAFLKSISDDAHVARLAADMTTYMTARQALAGETYRPDSGRLTKLVLSLYAADRFAVHHKANPTRAWYLVGDAAMGVPYFRALNCGILISSQLTAILSSRLSAANKMAAYNGLRPLYIASEFMGARSKNAGLAAYNKLRKAFVDAPWQLINWDADTAGAFRARNNVALTPDDDEGGTE